MASLIYDTPIQSRLLNYITSASTLHYHPFIAKSRSKFTNSSTFYGPKGQPSNGKLQQIDLAARASRNWEIYLMVKVNLQRCQHINY
jgi:hypothetical protein